MTSQPGTMHNGIESAPRINPLAHRRRRRILVTALLLSLAGVLAFLAVAFQPLADAAGGCGGG